MPQKPPLLTLKEFLSKSMSSEVEAGFSEFLGIWKSSESLRILIYHIVLNDSLESTESQFISAEINSREPKRNGPLNQNKAIQELIDRDAVSPLSITEQSQQSHGGLSRKELLVLLDRYKAGKRSLGLYMLVRSWKKVSHASKPLDIRLRQLTFDLFIRAVSENRADFFDEISDTIKFLQKEGYQENGHWTHDPEQWWQFHLLLYILEHPKEKYPMREFVRHFQEEVGANEMPTTKTLRKFCRSHGIRLDSTPGAPRKNKATR